MSEPRIAPSLLSADLVRLGEDLAAIEKGGAALVHVDVMDGHFVPNLTLGPGIVRAVRRASRLPIDVHLMIEEPDRFLEAFRREGADWISVHWEACRHLQRTLARIRELGARAGVVVNPATPIAVLAEAVHDADYVLLMSVNPGFGGQSFLPRSLARLAELQQLVARSGRPVEIEIDGGIDETNAAAVAAAGAGILVAGSAVFGRADARDPRAPLERRLDPAEAVRRLRAAARGEPAP